MKSKIENQIYKQNLKTNYFKFWKKLKQKISKLEKNQNKMDYFLIHPSLTLISIFLRHLINFVLTPFVNQ